MHVRACGCLYALATTNTHTHTPAAQARVWATPQPHTCVKRYKNTLGLQLHAKRHNNTLGVSLTEAAGYPAACAEWGGLLLLRHGDDQY